ncbi:bifunctional oligoribonuclease/PAP phosphatase NrnA [Pediococcus acidilactici]|uniref:DHH family phosphoesterase n=1 Tax=Pediococcus acidilactici TaxID=1254 RepID=UPI000E5D7191|nr:bifunctional oligoribonuclease/PAP phosphatase NrnA [Pediococcus acidilactici]KAF0366396.1 bifunctional oligoribonuclease/PAP phosphatase NrnA [Pediococcus acidilactici]KAF0515281.1 bifunctional oligoribonuclease/PAP phosphatase NrnA [Pediococcus acidilactici]MCT3037019.1 bifunctional oligoribonuclease/PAP phosphatase NrnA [Pediococcus acidilactici]QQC46290.1 bifunctional oligoribonuclease/PAP phosphatase NrnA [Pediococcus acidilactici]RJF52714.1 bifunctional oligoribonuclease/PAP phosphata
MDTQEKILAQIKKYNRIVIHRHQRPDPDAIGSQVGLAKILQASFPHKQIKVVGKQIDGLSWLGQMDDVDNDFFDDALVIVIDTANAPRIDDRRFDQGAYLIKIDHHPNDEPFGDLMWVKEAASSSSELVYDFYNQFKAELVLPQDAASDLYAGIVGDTGRFMYSATSAHTHEVVAGLMATGFDMVKVNQILDEIPVSVAHLSAYLYDHLTISERGAAHLVLTKEILEKFDLKDAGTAGIVPLPGHIAQVQCWAIFVEQDDHSFRVRLRSKGPVINELAKRHHGGGHPLASGAKAADRDEVTQIVKELEELV